MWEIIDDETRELLVYAIPSSDKSRIVKYLFARGCGNAFHSLQAIRDELQVVKSYRDDSAQIDEFVKSIRAGKQVSEKIYDTAIARVEMGEGSRELSDLQANLSEIIIRFDVKDPAALRETTGNLIRTWDEIDQEVEDITGPLMDEYEPQTTTKP